MLTCVEMAIFALLHLFAFPWKPYDLGTRHEQLPQGVDTLSPELPKTYAHGPIRALLDALNPWDIIKACGRGFRWLFVGVRYRKNDPSYQTKLGPMSHQDTGYHGPTFAGNGEAAVEIKASDKQTGKNGLDDSDTSALLSHAQANPYVHQESGSYYSNSPHDGARNPDSLPAAPTPGQEYGVATPSSEQRSFKDFEPQSMTYNGVPKNSTTQNSGRDPGRSNNDWDMFAGATGAKPPRSGPPGFI